MRSVSAAFRLWLCAVTMSFGFAFHGPHLPADPREAAKGPTCSPGAICFSGLVSKGEEFRYALNSKLDFLLRPGWTIAIAPTHPEAGCQEFASVVNPPYHAHRALDIDTSYGWKAEEEVSASPRKFRFVTNCRDYRTESERLSTALWGRTLPESIGAQARLGTSPLGMGLLWITNSKITHASDASYRLGAILEMRFVVEIKLPAAR